jgi:hypothetical protein
MLVGLAIAAAGCSPVNGATAGDLADVSTACTAGAPASCPAATATPSYSLDVAPVLRTYCTGCHAPGGQEHYLPLDTYHRVSGLAGLVEGEVGGCDMPPPEASQPTQAQRNIVLDWIACGAPNN